MTTIVCKIGGSVIEGVNPTIIADIKKIISEGGKLVLVHGGGDQVTSIAEKMGKKQQFVTSPEGIRSRYTDKETADIFTMVMSGLLAKQITKTLQKSGINAVSLTGIDGKLLSAVRKKKLIIIDDRNRKLVIDGGYTGKISEVNTSLLDTLLTAGYVPVVSPVAMSEEFDLLNVDGDRACSSVSSALKSDSTIFLTDTEGLILDGRVVNKLSVREARESIPRIGPGMNQKIMAAIEAVEMGSRRSIIASGLKEHPIANALSSGGTLITN